MLAMSAMSMQLLSAGRFRLGVGTSGPQVMEGWHGVKFDAPLAVTRETIEIVRAVSVRPAAHASGPDVSAATARRPGQANPFHAACHPRAYLRRFPWPAQS